MRDPHRQSLVCTAPGLLVEVVHVGDQVLDHVHVGQYVDLNRLVVGLDPGQARQCTLGMFGSASIL